MKLKDIPKSELELMGYDDIAYVILSESKKKLKINELFKKICDALEMSEEEEDSNFYDEEDDETDDDNDDLKDLVVIDEEEES